MAVHSRDRDNKELGAIGGKKPVSRQPSSSSRPSSIAIMESIGRTLIERMQQHGNRLIQYMDPVIERAETTNSTLAGISTSHTELHRSQTDLSARLERIVRASPDLNPVELRTNPSDGNFVFHAVPTQVTAPLIATRPSITSEVSEVIS